MNSLRSVLFAALVFILLSCFISACESDGNKGDSANPQTENDDVVNDDMDDDSANGDNQNGFSYPYCHVDESKIDEIMSRMTLKQKIAQMYIVGVSIFPWFISEEDRHLIEEEEVGGVYVQALTGIGIWPEWTAENMNNLQNMAMSHKIPIPLFISIDQEGGIPQALNTITGGTDLPGNLGLGAAFDPNATYFSYGIMGQELAALGVNTDFAPVAELMISHEETSMYTRCFGERTKDVSLNTQQAVRGLQENRVIATAKHFPSHSTAPGDEHFFLTVNNEDEKSVREKYLPPFIAAIEAGVDMIMMTHAVYTAWDPGVPSGFSHRIVTGILRDELGFEGLIVTDDINMGSITLHPWDELPDVMAIEAGVDMVVDCFADKESMFGTAEENRRFPYDVEGQINYVLRALNDGRLSEESIDASVRRILRTKMKYCLFINPYADIGTAAQKERTQENIKKSIQLHENAITLVRDHERILPLNPNTGIRIHVVAPAFFQLEMYPDAAWGNLASTDLVKEIRKIAPTTTGDTFVAGPNPVNIDFLVAGARDSGADVLVIGTYNALYYEHQKELVKKLLELNLPTILIATAMPYDLLAFPDISTYVVTYSNRDIALETVARVLFGYIEPKGHLPVSIPGLYGVGWGESNQVE